MVGDLERPAHSNREVDVKSSSPRVAQEHGIVAAQVGIGVIGEAPAATAHLVELELLPHGAHSASIIRKCLAIRVFGATMLWYVVMR
jgi:hypothetical protein